MNKRQKFENFLESLKGSDQDTLIESVKKGFHACYEAFTFNSIEGESEEDKKKRLDMAMLKYMFPYADTNEKKNENKEPVQTKKHPYRSKSDIKESFRTSHGYNNIPGYRGPDVRGGL